MPAAVLACAVQVSLLLDQADQYDEAANAALKGIRAEPQQPELPRLRQALKSVKKVLLLAESQDVSGGRLVHGSCSYTVPDSSSSIAVLGCETA